MSRFKHSGLAGPFREASQEEPRENLLIAIESLYDLLYLLGEVLSHFHRISDSLGDYGMIRVSSWLHPCPDLSHNFKSRGASGVDSMIEKVQRLQSSLKGADALFGAMQWLWQVPLQVVPSSVAVSPLQRFERASAS